MRISSALLLLFLFVFISIAAFGFLAAESLDMYAANSELQAQLAQKNSEIAQLRSERDSLRQELQAQAQIYAQLIAEYENTLKALGQVSQERDQALAALQAVQAAEPPERERQQSRRRLPAEVAPLFGQQAGLSALLLLLSGAVVVLLVALLMALRRPQRPLQNTSQALPQQPFVTVRMSRTQLREYIRHQRGRK